MDLHVFILVSAILTTSEGFTVKGSSGPLVVPLGGSVVLPCSVDSLLPLEDLEVEWRRSDSETLIHLYQDGDIRPDAQHQDYHDRAHFFTEDIKHGNFSLLLNNLTAEDEGKYTCKVHTGQESGETGVEIKHVERLVVSGSSRSISASVGGDVTLSCSVNSHIKPEEIEEVSWKKIDKDEEIPVLLYQYNETLSDASDERFIDRVEFFTDDIHRGNFSLRLKRVRTEDKGVYICQVFTGELSANTTVILQQLGFSVLHIMVLILCITGCGSALLFCSLIYSRSNNTGFIVECFDGVRLGGSAVLSCVIDPHLVKKGLKVEWRRSGLKSPVCVYQDGDIRNHQDYHDRANFFTEDIKHGNFSLQLKNLTAEDEGQYTCKAYRKWISAFSVNVNLKEGMFGFWVKCSYYPVVPPGGSVILPSFNNQPLPEEGLKVEWSKSGLQDPVCVYQDGHIRNHQDYHDRAHFFTEDIKHGNFSLLLKNLTAEDNGQYTCRVYTGQRSVFSASPELVPRLLDSVYRLRMCLIFCPNLIMFFAFIFWGVSEGSVYETICCCALYLLRPLTLLWAAPYINDFQEKIKKLIKTYSYVAEYFVLTAVVYSALFTNTLEKLLNYAVFERVLILVLYVLMFICCFSKSIYILVTQIGNKKGKVLDIFDIISDLTFEILPTLQFILLFYTFAATGGIIIIVAVLPMILTATNERMFRKCYLHFDWSRELRRTVMLIVTLVMNAVMIGFFIFTLDNQTDPIGWACAMVFLQILWPVVRLSDQSYYLSFSLDFPRYISVYVFGSVGVVLISAVALITELTLKTVNGERALMDLRFIVFPSECLFILSVMILGQLGSKIKTHLQSCQKTMRSKLNSCRRSQQNQDSPENQVELMNQTEA